MTETAALKRNLARTKVTRLKTYLSTFNPDAGNVLKLNERLKNAENLIAGFDNCAEKTRAFDEDEDHNDDLEAEYI